MWRDMLTDLDPDLVIDKKAYDQRLKSIIELSEDEQFDYLCLRGWRQILDGSWYLPGPHKMHNHTGHNRKSAIEIQVYQDLSKVRLREANNNQ